MKRRAVSLCASKGASRESIEPHARSTTVAAPERNGAEIIRAIALSDVNAENVPALRVFDRLALGAFALQGLAMQRRNVRGKPANRAREAEARRYATACLASVLGKSVERVAARYDPWLVLVTDPAHVDTTEREAALHLAYRHCLAAFWPRGKLGAIRIAVRKAGASVGLDFEDACHQFADLFRRGRGPELAFVGKDGQLRIAPRQTRDALLQSDRTLRRKRSDRPPDRHVASTDRLDTLRTMARDHSEALDLLDTVEIAAVVEAARARATKLKQGSKRRLVLEHFGELLAGRREGGLSIRALALRSNCGRSHLQRIYNLELAALRRRYG